MRTYKEYFTNMYKENFTSTTLTKADKVAVYTYVVLAVLFTILYSYGAARLSWCYNIHIGNSKSEAFMWALLNLFFSSIYYPYYAIFLNPLCKKK